MIKINTKTELDNLIKENPDSLVIVKFGANWCSPCRVLEKTIGSFTLDESEGVCFAEVDADEAEENLLEEYTIRSIPVLLFFKGGLLAKKEIGLHTKEDLLKIISELKTV